VQGDGDLAAVAGDRLVRGVVDHLLGQVVRPVGERVHAGPPAHRLEPGEDLDGGGVVGAGHRNGALLLPLDGAHDTWGPGGLRSLRTTILTCSGPAARVCGNEA